MKKLLPLLSIFILFIFGFVALTTKIPVIVDIAWIALALFGAYMSLSSVIYSVKCYKSKFWPQSLYVLRDEEVRDRSIDKKKKDYVMANIEYEVEGKKYIKDLRDDYNESFFDNPDEAIKYIKNIQSNPYKTIYFNPENPEDSILKPGMNVRSILAILVGFGLVYIAIASLFGAIKWA